MYFRTLIQNRPTKQSDILAIRCNVDTLETELERTLKAVKSVKTLKYKGLLGQVIEVVLLKELWHLAVHTDVRLDIYTDAKKRYNNYKVMHTEPDNFHTLSA